MRRFSLAVVGACGLASVLLAQQPGPPASEVPPVTFRAEVNYIEVDAFVTDAQGNPITDLTQNDFEIREDGKPQTISSFSLVNIPIEQPERPLFTGAPLDVQTNEHLDGRIYLIVLDDLHTAIANTPRVKDALHRFVEQHVGMSDLAAVVFTGGRAVDAQDFTNNPRLLVAAIDKFSGQKLPSVTIERLQNLQNDRPSDQDNDASERAHRARVALATINRLAEFMGNVRGRRKAMLLVSEGPDYNLADVVGFDRRPFARNDAPSAATDVLQGTRDAIAAATRSNVTIYALDPRGLHAEGEDLIDVSSVPKAGGLGEQSLREERQAPQSTLGDLAASTGGFAAVNTNDLNGAFDRIVRESSTYYLIGYYSTNQKRDGTFRTVDVRAKRPRVTVRARKGYTAPKGSAPASVRPGGAVSSFVMEALSSPLPIAGVPLRLYASAFKDTPRAAVIPIVLEVDVSRFAFTQQNGTYNDKVEMAYAAVATNSKIYSARRTVALALKPDTYEHMKAGGLRLIAQTNLPPGRYQLHVAAGEVGGKAGSVLYSLDVPDFSKAPLSLSGIAITSQTAAHAITRVAASNDWLKDLLPGPVTALRDFPTGDMVTVYGEVYESAPSATHFIDIRAELRDEGHHAVRTVAFRVSSAQLEPRSGGYGFTAKLSLDDLKPGLYAIHIEARSQVGAQPMVSRDIAIHVSPF